MNQGMDEKSVAKPLGMVIVAPFTFTFRSRTSIRRPSGILTVSSSLSAADSALDFFEPIWHTIYMLTTHTRRHAPRPYSTDRTDCGRKVTDADVVAEHSDDVDCKSCLHRRLLREERAAAFRDSGATGAWLSV